MTRLAVATAIAPPDTALADDGGDVGHADAQAGFGRAGDGFGLSALLGADAGIGAGGIDERDDGNFEVIGHVHKPHRLAVALRPRHAEIVPQAAVGVGALLVADDAHALAAEPAEAADDGCVFAELAVAGERHEILDQLGDIIDAMRPLRMPRHLRLLPGRQLGIEGLERLRRLDLDAADLFADGDGIAAGLERAQFLDLGLELGHGLFKVEV